MKTFSIQGAGKVVRDIDASSCRELDCKSNKQGSCVRKPRPVASTKDGVCPMLSNP